jgi:hypothetical protein
VTVESECELLDFEVPNTNLEDALKIWDEEWCSLILQEKEIFSFGC